MHQDILGIGAAFIDTVIFVDDAYLTNNQMEKGSVTPIDEASLQQLLHNFKNATSQYPGGSCANVIRALSKMGWKCTLTGKIGEDEPAEFLLKDLKQKDIEAHYIPTHLPTGRVICFVTPDGERTMRDFLGASTAMKGQDLDPQLFNQKKLVHIEGYALFNDDLVETSMKYASQNNNVLSFDLANFKVVAAFKDRIKYLLENFVDIVFANQHEAQEFTGLHPKDACKQLSQTCEYAIVTQSAEGCWIGHQNELIHIPAYKVPKVIDTTGAGDLFAAGFLDALLNKRPIDQCGKQGAYLASKVLGIQGAALPEDVWQNTLRNYSEKG